MRLVMEYWGQYLVQIPIEYESKELFLKDFSKAIDDFDTESDRGIMFLGAEFDYYWFSYHCKKTLPEIYTLDEWFDKFKLG